MSDQLCVCIPAERGIASIITMLLSMCGGVIVYKAIASSGDTFIKAGLSGKDLCKKDNKKIIPESMGMVSGTVFLAVSCGRCFLYRNNTYISCFTICYCCILVSHMHLLSLLMTFSFYLGNKDKMNLLDVALERHYYWIALEFISCFELSS